MINCRPISVLPCFSKLIEKHMHVQLMSYLTTNNVLNPSQHSFRPKQNVTMTIIDMLNNVTTMKANRLFTLLLFIDISKAFNSLSHLILLDKLQHYGIRGIEHQWFARPRSNCFLLCSN